MQVRVLPASTGAPPPPSLPPSGNAGGGGRPHSNDWQSLLLLHCLPLPHGAQPPPQSVSVSVPLRLPSPQVVMQVPAAHWLSAPQSPSAMQPSPSAQRGQDPLLPPQSVSVSLP